MRFAGIALKIVVAILLFMLFSLFLLYAAGFGEDGNLADLALSNLLLSAMILVLVVSVILSLMLDFYERSKYQSQEVYQGLSEKIAKLEELAPQLRQSMTENAEKITDLAAIMNEKIEENSAKFAEYMTQFANLSVQVFAKDKSAENMAHEEKINLTAPQKTSGDYFNHYTNAPKEEKTLSVKQPQKETETSEIVELQPEDKLSAIFNDDLAQTLSELEIMKDDEVEKESQDIDLTSYFSDSKKIQL